MVQMWSRHRYSTEFSSNFKILFEIWINVRSNMIGRFMVCMATNAKHSSMINLPRPSKMKLFQATVESILLYGSETWTVTTKIRKMLDGCYTRLLRSALNISWKAHVTNEQLYGDLPKASDKIKKRRLQFAGHCLRSSGQVVSDLVLWKPVHGKRGAGRPIMTYVDLLCQNQLKSRPAWKIGMSGESSQMSDRMSTE